MVVFEKSIRADFQKHIYAQTYMKAVLLKTDQVCMNILGHICHIYRQIGHPRGSYDGSLVPRDRLGLFPARDSCQDIP